MPAYQSKTWKNQSYVAIYPQWRLWFCQYILCPDGIFNWWDKLCSEGQPRKLFASAMNVYTIYLTKPCLMQFLTFVYCRLDTSLAGTKAMNPAPYAGSYGRVYSRFADSVDSLLFSIRTKISRKKPLSEAQKMAKRSPSIRMNRLDIDTEEEGFQAEPRLMGPIQNLLYDSIAISAMQFGGYLTQTSKSQVQIVSYATIYTLWLLFTLFQIREHFTHTCLDSAYFIHVGLIRSCYQTYVSSFNRIKGWGSLM